MPAIGCRNSTCGNRDFLAAVSLALAALAISGALLLSLLLAGTLPTAEAGRNGGQDGLVVGSNLGIHIGQGNYDDAGRLSFERLSRENRALATARVSIAANRYPFVRYRLANRHPGQILYLIWRNDGDPDALFRNPLPLGDVRTLRMDGDPNWSGHITEIGFEVYGDLRGVPLVVESLEFPQAGPLVTLESLWSQWTEFPGWQLSSINHLARRAVPDTVPVVAAAAAWAALAALLLCWPVSRLRSGGSVCLATAILVPWVVLDLSWQGKLQGQLADARALFSDKTMHEKHLVDIDSDIYRHAMRLKNEQLPSSAARIFLLHDATGHNFRRLKTQYYLLPHNVFNYGIHPPLEAIRRGDFVLALGPVPGLTHRDDRLHWEQEPAIPARIVDRDPHGTLYLVTGESTGARQ